MSLEKIKIGEDSRKTWRKVNDIIEALDKATARLENAERRILELERRNRGGKLHPFCIYSHPSEERDTPTAADWRTFRVRAGTVFINGTEVTVTGTDGADEPDTGALAATGDIEVPEDDPQFWFWLELTGGGSPAASVESGSTPPTWDETHIPIGWVDVFTNAEDQSPIIRQFIRTDLDVILC